MFKQSGLGLYN